MVTVPLFRDHRILTQVAGHHMNVVKALPPLVIEEPSCAGSPPRSRRCWARAETRLFRSYASARGSSWARRQALTAR